MKNLTKLSTDDFWRVVVELFLTNKASHEGDNQA